MKRSIIFFITIFIGSLLFAQHAPYIYNVSGTQRTDGSKIVDIFYNVLEPDADTLIVSLQVSADDGATFAIIPADSLLNGDIGWGVMSGNDKHIIWQAGEEETLTFEGTTYKFKVIADDDTVVPGTVTDIDGNVYQTLVIGEQEWMIENLKVTHYRNGDPIPNVTDNDTWVGLSTGAYCYYDNDANNADTYGALYNWYAVDDSRGLAPEGWHIPSDEEIKELEMYLGMSQSQANSTGCRGTNEGSKLAGGYDLWDNGVLRNDPEFGSSGFSFLPSGSRFSATGAFSNMGRFGYFWSSTEYGSLTAWYRTLGYLYTSVQRSHSSKQFGFSVRCVRDLE